MRWIEEGSNLTGKLLRPLCAQVLEPTDIEKKGLIDRDKLLRITGRSRKPQIKLAESLSITEYSTPAGGCRLTDHDFARRMKDTLDHGYRNFRETIALQWGRHFRIAKNFKAIVGRDEKENESLKYYAHREDHIMELANKLGPTLILKGNNPTEDILKIAAGLIQQFSKFKDDDPQMIEYWRAHQPDEIHTVNAHISTASQMETMRI
jgi:tRNA-uridine 2-sulfurtransferase